MKVMSKLMGLPKRVLKRTPVKSEKPQQLLSDLKDGQMVEVTDFKDPLLFSVLGNKGIIPGEKIRIYAHGPFKSPIILEHDQIKIAMRSDLANNILFKA